MNLALNLEGYINHATVIFGILGFLYTWYKLRKKLREVKLENLLIGAFTGSTIPTGLVLIWSAFDQSIILKLEGLNMHIAAAGLALLFIAYKSLYLD